MKERKLLHTFLACLMLSVTVDAREQGKFPVPSGVDNMLFYIQRTVNANTHL